MKEKLENIFSITAWAAQMAHQMAQTVDVLFSNVAYRLTQRLLKFLVVLD